MCIRDRLLTERIGDTGKRLHTGRSRNDQVALDMRLYVKSEIREIITMICTFMKALAKKSRENLDAVMPGYTHLQRAQPTTFAHYMMAYANMLKRDITRLQDCYERMDEMPLGSGALASTTCLLYTSRRSWKAKRIRLPSMRGSACSCSSRCRCQGRAHGRAR